MTDRVYKIVRRAEWAKAQETGIFTGSADDRRDGFIHLSTASQVRATFERYFAREDGTLLLVLETGRFTPALKWEPSRGGEDFPHLYGELPLASIASVVPIGRGPDGRPIFPPEIA
jgi:uncharacterized protein (DUF952 family)